VITSGEHLRQQFVRTQTAGRLAPERAL